MYLTLNTAVLVVFGLVAINAGVVLLLGCAHQAPSWVREARRHRTAAER